MMQSPIIIANLKCNPATIRELFKLQENIWNRLEKDRYKYYLAVPYIFINDIIKEKYKAFVVGAQNFDLTEEDSFTGQISINQVLDTGIKFTILGHSEARARGDSNINISKKVNSALRSGIDVVLCIGEKSRESSENNQNNYNYLEEIKKMLTESLTNIDRRYTDNLVIAYEPLWAIGTNRAASVDNCLEAAIQIRRSLVDMFGITNAKKIKVLYGGSVDETNAASFVKMGGVDGVLVGRASLNAEKFAGIINTIYEI